MLNILLTYILIILGLLAGNFPAKDIKPLTAVAEVSAERLLYSELIASGKIGVNLPSYDVFTLAFEGYAALKGNNCISKNILTIVDFSLASTEKRLWIIDMDQKKILYNDLVAHGRNSGDNFAGKFSNIPQSNMSSIGFYVTGDTYTGKHGLSLYLDGQETEFNGKARERAIVIHGADYVSEDFIRTHGRLGRSFGCPALSMESHKSIIETIRQGSCLFIYYPDESYLEKSTVLNHNRNIVRQASL